jgi:hypothetical protein
MRNWLGYAANLMDPGWENGLGTGAIGPAQVYPGRPNAQEFDWMEAGPQGTGLVAGAGMPLVNMVGGLSKIGLHQLGFMPNSKKISVEDAIKQGIKGNESNMVWLRPEESIDMFRNMPEFKDMVRVKIPRGKILEVANRDVLANRLGWENRTEMGHSDNLDVAREIAKRLTDRGYIGFKRLDFPEMAIVTNKPLKVIGKAK